MEAEAIKAPDPMRWTIVFHRKAENWFFSLIALGEFKHVSAFAWCPDTRVWLVYDVGFRRTRCFPLPDTPESKSWLGRVIAGNAIVTMPVRTDAVPIMRLGLFCTTAIKHLIGLRSGALRPDALFASCLRHGGELSDDAGSDHSAANRSQPGGRTGAGDADPASAAAGSGAG